ncbi:MAG: DUF4838 domain-containing protein [Kiritimatiellia bacterium]
MALPQPSAATDLILVQDGVAQLPIIVFEDAPPFTLRAANEMADYIEKISGARPAVIDGCPDPVPEHAIWVGYQPKLDELFPEIDFNFRNPEEILIVCDGKNLVIAGRDRWDPDHMIIQLRGNWRLPEHGQIMGLQMEYGTINAVYTFIQDYLNVRWLWPGEIGEDILRSDTIAVPVTRHRHYPRFRGRSGIFTRWSINSTKPNVNQNWLKYQRVLLDSLSIPGGHGFSAWWDKYHATHPEYFALQPDGTRGGGEHPYPSPKNVKMCKSNPAVWEQWLDNVAEALEENPNLKVFNASAGDGFLSGYCICDNCRAWDNPQGVPYTYSWRGISQEYVAMTDRQVTFANHLGRGLKERFPGQDLYVLIMAYGPSQPPPVAAVPDDNVIVSGVFSFHKRKWTGRVGNSDLATLHKERFLAWGQIAPNFAWRPNLGFGPLWARGLPDVAPEAVMEDFRLVADNNVIAIFFDMVWGHWATQGPHYYMLARMAWDPYADGPAILDDYYRRGFGPAADAVRAYWELMAAAAARIIHEELPLPEVYTAEFLNQAEAHLNRAASLLANAPERYRQRVEFVRRGLDYTRLLLAAQAQMALFRASGDKDLDAEARARAIWVDQIWPLVTSKDFPAAFEVINLRPGHQRAMSGLYPADLDRRW